MGSLVFGLTDSQKKAAAEFMDSHKAPPSTIGGQFTFHFTITSIGHVVRLSDNYSKDELDLTDYDSF